MTRLHKRHLQGKRSARSRRLTLNKLNTTPCSFPASHRPSNSSSANPTATFCRSMSSTRRPRSKSWRKKLREPPRGSSQLGCGRIQLAALGGASGTPAHIVPRQGLPQPLKEIGQSAHRSHVFFEWRQGAVLEGDGTLEAVAELV